MKSFLAIFCLSVCLLGPSCMTQKPKVYNKRYIVPNRSAELDLFFGRSAKERKDVNDPDCTMYLRVFLANYLFSAEVEMHMLDYLLRIVENPSLSSEQKVDIAMDTFREYKGAGGISSAIFIHKHIAEMLTDDHKELADYYAEAFRDATIIRSEVMFRRHDETDDVVKFVMLNGVATVIPTTMKAAYDVFPQKLWERMPVSSTEYSIFTAQNDSLVGVYLSHGTGSDEGKLYLFKRSIASFDLDRLKAKEAPLIYHP